MRNNRISLGVFLASILLLLTACNSNSNASSQQNTSIQHVRITETDFHIASNTTTFQTGVHYQFTITNNGKMTHEFMIMPRSEAGMDTASMDAMDKMALAKVESISPDQTATLDYTFPPSAARSQPEFACYFPGHYMAGMRLEVRVAP